MAQGGQTLTTFQTRVRQMILRFRQLQTENEALRKDLDKCRAEIKNLHEKLERQADEHQSLKMAKMMEIADGDAEKSKDRLSKLIRDVNKCIALLTEQK